MRQTVSVTHISGVQISCGIAGLDQAAKPARVTGRLYREKLEQQVRSGIGPPLSGSRITNMSAAMVEPQTLSATVRAAITPMTMMAALSKNARVPVTISSRGLSQDMIAGQEPKERDARVQMDGPRKRQESLGLELI